MVEVDLFFLFLYIHLTFDYMAAFSIGVPLNNTLELRNCSHSSYCNIFPPPEPHKNPFLPVMVVMHAWDAIYKKRKQQADKDHAK